MLFLQLTATQADNLATDDDRERVSLSQQCALKELESHMAQLLRMMATLSFYMYEHVLDAVQGAKVGSQSTQYYMLG